MERTISARSPLFGCLLAVFFIICTSLLGECHSKPTNYPLSNGFNGFGKDDVGALYLDSMGDAEKRGFNLGESRQVFPQQNHVHTSYTGTKRGPPGQAACPPGIDERECYYDLMAVWMRMLMKEEQLRV